MFSPVCHSIPFLKDYGNQNHNEEHNVGATTIGGVTNGGNKAVYTAVATNAEAEDIPLKTEVTTV